MAKNISIMVINCQPAKIYLAAIISYMATFWEWFIAGHNDIIMVLVVLINMATLVYIIMGIRKRLIEGNSLKRKLKK